MKTINFNFSRQFLFFIILALLPTKLSAQCPDGNHPHMIDLGLPSGTKWACCNVGANNPEARGGYYAWGETEEKENYTYDTYKWKNKNNNLFVDYRNKTARNKTVVLNPQDDVAHVKWGGNWRMPTKEEVDELCNNTTAKVEAINNVWGAMFKSKINGTTLFLPAVGWRYYDQLGGDGGKNQDFLVITELPHSLILILIIYYGSN